MSVAAPIPVPLSELLNESRVSDGLAIGVVCVVSIVALMTFRDYGLSWDDYAHAEYGDLLLAYYASGLRDQRALSFVNLHYYGGGFDLLAAIAAKALPLTVYESRRLTGAAVGVLGLIITWRTGRRIGGPRAGLLALVLLAACPLYYGHMFMNPKDSPFAVAMALCQLGLVRALAEYPRPSMSAIALAGVGFGLAFGSRIMGAFAAIAALASTVFIFAVEWRANGIRAGSERAAPIHPGAGAGRVAGLRHHGAGVALVRRYTRSTHSAQSAIFRTSSKLHGRSCLAEC